MTKNINVNKLPLYEKGDEKKSSFTGYAKRAPLAGKESWRVR